WPWDHSSPGTAGEYFWMLFPVSRYPSSPCAISITRLTSIATSQARYLNRHPVDPRRHGGIPGSVNGKAVDRLGGVAYGDEHAGDRGARSQQHHGGFREEPTRKRDRGLGPVVVGYRLVELQKHFACKDFWRQFLRGDQLTGFPHVHMVPT